MTRSLLRAVAFIVAVAGVIDPAITRRTPTKPDVALIASDSLPDPALVDRVANALAPHFTIVRGPSIGSAAVVSVGYQLAGAGGQNPARAFAVFPEPRQPYVGIAAITSPSHALLQARTPIDVRAHVVSGQGHRLTATLRHDGVAIDQVERPVTSNDVTETVRFEFFSHATGLAGLTVEAGIDGVAMARTAVSTQIEDERWAVLFFDRRPSWMSTFVRRALDDDPRFVVTSRVAISREAVAATAGKPPSALASLPSLELFHTVIAGAPESLTDDDAKGLERFMRDRGGRVVLLFDQPDTKAYAGPLQSLTGVSRWTVTEKATPSGRPLASAVLRPQLLPSWAEAVEEATSTSSDPGPMWQMAVGRGTLVVSGALDAWRYRDDAKEPFDRYFRNLVAHASENAAGAARAAARSTTSSTTPKGLAPDERALVKAWASAHGGRTFGEGELASLAPALSAALKPAAENRTDHPMRSPWWIVPFAAALGVEWWNRRRRGLR